MTLIVNKGISAFSKLQFEKRDIVPNMGISEPNVRSLRILILNLMPNKEQTEYHLLDLLDLKDFQIEVEFLYAATHMTKNSSDDYIKKNYKCFHEIKKDKWDGIIITGAPVELLDFEDVDYWLELKNIFDWINENDLGAYFICWAAQAALYHYYNIPKYKLHKKMFGVFNHKINTNHKITRDLEYPFIAPHSRHTEILKKDIEKIKDLVVVSESNYAGVYIVANEYRKHLYVTGHPEYDVDRLKVEYRRDLLKGIPIAMPENYFPNNKPNLSPKNTWQNNAKRVFRNWVENYVFCK